MGELEAGVGQSVYPLDHLGLPFNMLRAFRRLLFLDTAEVLGSPLVRELPASVVLHHLYSRAPAELQSPMQFSPCLANPCVCAALQLLQLRAKVLMHTLCVLCLLLLGTSCCKQSVMMAFVPALYDCHNKLDKRNSRPS